MGRSGLFIIIVVGLLASGGYLWFSSHKANNEAMNNASTGWGNVRPFPLPAPLASAKDVLPDKYLIDSGGAGPSLGTVADKIARALDAGGYHELTFLPVADGFAMITRMERINENGTPASHDRFNADFDLRGIFTLSEYIQALFTANPGYYRVIVFIVTPHLISQAGSPITSVELTTWLNRGTDKLPDTVAGRPYDMTKGYHCTALIYEFKKEQTQETATPVNPSHQQGRDHLRLSGMWDALTK